ncbi:MAG: Ig-like domain-containing protein, partial [Patescibacteria group bacterium]
MEKTKDSRSRKMQVIFGLLLIIIVTGLLVSQRKGGGILPAPESIIFEGHQKVSETSSLRMTFPEKMDTESLKENMDAPIAGEATWEGNTMVFEPNEELKKGETYTFTVNRTAKYASGAPINKDTEYRFTVAGPPVLSSNYPSSDATDIDPKSKIHLVFDRPIIPLSAVQGSGVKKYPGIWPVTITPAVNGEWRWLGTTTVEFTPGNKLTPATTYTVSVPKGITTINGDKTLEDFSWNFETVRPEVVGTDPYDYYDLNGPDTKITLSFNQEMELEKAINNIRISQITEDKPIELSFDLKYGYDEVDEKKQENRNKLMVVPVKPLSLNTAYQVTVSKDIKGAKGDLGSMADFVLNLSTVGDLKVNKFENTYERLFLEFSNPVDNETLKGNLILEPTPEGWDEVELKTSEWSDNRELYIYTNLKPSTAYKLTLTNQVKDNFGQELIEPYTQEFTTAALEPNLEILSKGEFGIFEKDRTPIYPFEAVNISRIDLEVARVPFEKFIHIRQNQKDNWEYAPNFPELIGYQKFSLKTANQPNITEIINFDIEKERGSKLIPGIYAMRVQTPEFVSTYENNKPIITYQYFSLTNNALTLKYSGNKALVWLVSMQTGAPVAEADIVFYNLKGNKVLTGKTDNEGFFETEIDLKQFQSNNNEWSPEFWVTATKNGDFTFLGSNWNNGLEPWNFGLRDSFRGPEQGEYEMDAYLYTERQAYRPGDTVYFKGLTRVRDKNGIISVPKNFDAKVSIYDASYNEIYNKTLS